MSDATPFFVVGFQRSGTTMLRLMLNAHPEVAIPHDSGEMWLSYRPRVSRAQGSGAGEAQPPGDALLPAQVVALVDELLAEPKIQAWRTPLPRAELLADPRPDGFAGVMRRFHVVYARQHGKRYWGDKNTGHLTELDQINAMFPTSKIVHLVRDGRDCALSHTGQAYVYGYENVLRAAIEWREQVTLCRKMGAMLPADRFFELRYEDLLASPELELRRLCAFLGLEFTPSMLTYHLSVDAHVPDERRGLWPLLDRPPVASNAFKWKTQMRAGDRAIFERNAGSLLRAYGYETGVGSVGGGHMRELWYVVHSRLRWRLRRLGLAARPAIRGGTPGPSPGGRSSAPAPAGAEGAR